MTSQIDQLRHETSEILAGNVDRSACEMFDLAKTLANHHSMDFARRLAERIVLRHQSELDDADQISVRQKWALWTSKTPDLNDEHKHHQALRILDSMPDGKSLASSNDPETLGIAGGICKRMWQFDGNPEHLFRSLEFYTRGNEFDCQRGDGYGGYNAVNAAFVLDLLSTLSYRRVEDEMPLQTEGATSFRRDVIDRLSTAEANVAEDYWYLVTLAEAHFGLQDYEIAGQYLQKAVQLEPPAWQIESTAQQFSVIARLHDARIESLDQSKPWRVLRDSLGESGAISLYTGKLGLALSGGGFRASLFHLGVLAALAELDLLRHIEALSCVSGGSIIGAYYYLEIRKLLESKRDEEITQDDYLDIVERIIQRFLSGVQKNLRMWVFGNPAGALRMLFASGYTETSRLGELLEKHFYDKVTEIADGDTLILQNLKITPKGTSSFRPHYENWTRANKVPVLILNASTLNTGHNWQFTSSWMGEPPSPVNSDISSNYRLRRLYYQDAPDRYRQLRLGQAVAASACVPSIFTPLELPDLFEGITVRLVDGGVCDNQGVVGLTDQGCSTLLISDASGQMGANDNPSDGMFRVPFRSNDMLMSRVRIVKYRELHAENRSGAINGFNFLHLKKYQKVDSINWRGCQEQREADSQPETSELDSNGHHGFVIRDSIRRKLADIRTDLDAFSDVEAYALMTSGYFMTKNELLASQFRKLALQGFPIENGRSKQWEFLEIAELLGNESTIRSHDRARTQQVERILDVARHRFFKLWRLSRPLAVVTWIISVALLAVLSIALIISTYGIIQRTGATGLANSVAQKTDWAAITITCGTLFSVFAIWQFNQMRRTGKTVRQILTGMFGLFAFIPVWIGNIVLNPWFLRLGRLPKRQSAGLRAEQEETTR